jgi:hypothetical protein
MIRRFLKCIYFKLHILAITNTDLCRYAWNRCGGTVTNAPVFYTSELNHVATFKNVVYFIIHYLQAQRQILIITVFILFANEF